MEKTTLKMDEVIDFMNHIAPNIGERFSVSQIQRKFRTGYINARKAIDELVELGYLEINMIADMRIYQRKMNEVQR